MTKIIIGSDHGGFNKKEMVKRWLTEKGYEVNDVGAMTLNMEDDFVDYAKKAVKIKTADDKIILFCRNGFGMCIAANRFAGVRCGLGFDVEAVSRGRNDDDINALSIPADYLDDELVVHIVEAFLNEKFSGVEQYRRRISKLDEN